MKQSLLVLCLSTALLGGAIASAASRPAAAIVAQKVAVDDALDQLRGEDRARDDRLRELEAGQIGGGGSPGPGGFVPGLELLGIRSGAPAATQRWYDARDKRDAVANQLRPGAEKFKAEGERLMAAFQTEKAGYNKQILAGQRAVEVADTPEKTAVAKARLESLKKEFEAVEERYFGLLGTYRGMAAFAKREAAFIIQEKQIESEIERAGSPEDKAAARAKLSAVRKEWTAFMRSSNGLFGQNSAAADKYWDEGFANVNVELDAANLEIDRLLAERRLNAVQP